jgi:DNA-binding transcriptional LysR family regulator
VIPPREGDPALHDTIVALCRGAGLAPTLVETAEPRLDAVLLAVAAGAGVAILPASTAEHTTLPGVRLIELAGSADAFEPAVVTHPDTDSMATLAFLRAVVQVGRRRDSDAARLRLVA